MGDAAASELTGTILLVAIAVVLAASFVVLLFLLPAPAPTTHAALQTYVEPASPEKIVVEHRGGPAIPLDQLRIAVTIDGATESFLVGEHLGTGWTVTSSSGAVKSSPTDLFAPGDQAIYTDADLPGKAASVLIADQGVNAVVLGTTTLQGADAVRPTFLSAITTSTTTIRVNFTEPLHAVSASDFTVGGLAISSVRLLGNGSSAEVTTTSAFASSATPDVGSVASPAGTRDFAGNLFAVSASVTPRDGVAPSITAGPGASGITSSGATIAWTTDEASTSVVGFGPTTLLGRTASDTTSVTSHSVPLSSLTPSTLYSYTVTSRDASGNAVTSSQGSLTTSAAASSGGSGTGTESNHLDFTAVASVTSGTLSSLYEVTLRAPNNTAVVASSPITINLATNSTHGHFLDPAGATINTSATIATGQSTAVFRYVDSRPGGRSVLTASASGVIPGSTTILVTGRTLQGIPDHLEFTGVPRQLGSGVVSTDFTVTLRNSNNQSVRPSQQLDVLLLTNSSQGHFVDSLDDTLTITRVSIGTGATSATFRYVDSRPNAVSAIVAMANGTTPASTVVEVAGRSGKGLPDHLEFTGVHGSLASGALSGAFTLTLRDSDNHTVRPVTPLVVTLATNSTSGHFVNETTSDIVTRVTLSPHQTTARFRYVDSRDGGVSVLTATANGTLPASTVVAVGAASTTASSTPQRLWFSSAPTTLDPSMLSEFFVVQLRDAGNATVTAPTPLSVLLSTNSSQGTFHNATTGALLDSVEIPAGASTATFQYRENRTGGRTAISASASGLADARASVGVHARGLVASSEDQGAVLTRVYYSTEVGDSLAGVTLGVSIVNPTNKSFTLARLVLTSSGVIMSSNPTQTAGTDAALSDCDAGTAGSQAFARVGSNLVATCDFADFTLGPYESRQAVVTFNLPNLGSATLGAFSATVDFASGSPASVTSPEWEYRHSGANSPGALVLLPRSGVNAVAGLGSATGLSAGSQTFTFAVAAIDATTTTTRLVVEFTVPAGWSDVNATSPDAATAVTLVQPTPTQNGLVRFATSTSFTAGTTKTLAFAATPPAMSDTGGFQRVVATMDGGGAQLVAGTYDFYLRFDP